MTTTEERIAEIRDKCREALYIHPSDAAFLCSQVSEMGAALEIAQQDTARLDALQSFGSVEVRVWSSNVREWTTIERESFSALIDATVLGKGDDLRAALDAARPFIPAEAPLSDSEAFRGSPVRETK